MSPSVWRFRGSPHYLGAQGDRLGLPRVLTDRARHNAELHRAAVLLGQLCEQYHRAPRGADGVPILAPNVRSRIEATIGQCELESGKLHACAAAAAAMIAEARRAFGLPAPPVHFGVSCDFDESKPESESPRGKPAAPGTRPRTAISAGDGQPAG